MIAALATAALVGLSLPDERPGWFVCDGIDRPLVVLAGQPDRRGGALFTLLDKRSGRTRPVALTVGPADPGAGQIYHALRRDGREIGNVHLVNPQMIDPPAAATIPTVTGVTLDGQAVQCRWLAATRLDGVTARRGVAITREGGGLVYRTFDFARPPVPPVRPDGVQRMAAPSLTLRGGTETRRPGGARLFRFASGGWTYLVSADAAGRATLRVQRGGRTIQRERFLGVALAD